MMELIAQSDVLTQAAEAGVPDWLKAVTAISSILGVGYAGSKVPAHLEKRRRRLEGGVDNGNGSSSMHDQIRVVNQASIERHESVKRDIDVVRDEVKEAKQAVQAAKETQAKIFDKMEAIKDDSAATREGIAEIKADLRSLDARVKRMEDGAGRSGPWP